MNTFYVFNAGCIRRALDMIQIQKYLLENGWRMTRRIKQADLIIVATCGVVKLNEINSLRAIAAARAKRRKGARIVVSGCLPKINPGQIHALGDFLIVPSGHLEGLDTVVNARTPFGLIGSPDSVTDNADITNYLMARAYCRRSHLYKRLFQRYGMHGPFLAASIRAFRTIDLFKNLMAGKQGRKIIPYFNIKIADGCLSHCAFCATKFATGKLRSRPLELILADFQAGLDKNYKVFQLIAEDTGAYGKDIDLDFTELLRRMFAFENDYQLAIIDCCPQWLIEQREALLPLLIAHQDKLKELFIPIQSGSENILGRMQRDYAAADVRSVLKELQDRAPLINLRTSFLVGFPGETEDDYAATQRFIAEMRFSEVTVNRYEDRPGTLASTMPDKVPPEIIEGRAQNLARELGCRILS